MSRPRADLWVVRHGRTEANARGLLLGRADPGLDEVGRAQAQALAAVVPREARVVTSPLRRARETAAAFAAAPEVDDAWVELDYGEWDGRPAGDVPAQAWAAWRSDPDFSPPGGESLGRLTARVHDALDRLVAEVDGPVVVVTHVSPVKAAMAWALGVGPEVAWRSFVAPASITTIGFGPPAPSLRSFNLTAHLPAG